MTALLLLLLVPAQAPAAGFDFADGTLAGWENDGFRVIGLGPDGTAPFAATSARQPGKPVLHRTFIVPPGVAEIGFYAAAYVPAGTKLTGRLDVVLEAAGRTYLSREVKLGGKWAHAKEILAPDGKNLREYRWLVGDHGGKKVRIAVFDTDAQTGCHVVAMGFTFRTKNDVNSKAFAADMLALQAKHGLPKLRRYDSRHFMALSNAGATQSEYRLDNCEEIYERFFPHFRRKGFVVTPPAEKMMVALFNSQEGLEAFMGEKMSSAVTGLYHTPSNRLVVYDFMNNRAFKDAADRAERDAKGGGTDLERQQAIVKFDRTKRDYRDDTNISTVMHEVAHQLSFNAGLLNRNGDAPVWLAEGLAVYCEATVNGSWQGIGEANPKRAKTLADRTRRGLPMHALRDMVATDDWIRKANNTEEVVLGYSQSWVLFRYLIEERPKALKAYMEKVYARKTPDHRLTDFVESFGDIAALERKVRAYADDVARREGK